MRIKYGMPSRLARSGAQVAQCLEQRALRGRELLELQRRCALAAVILGARGRPDVALHLVQTTLICRLLAHRVQPAA